MRKTTTALIALAALAIPTTAAATDGPYPVDTQPQLGPYLPVARAAWPNSPCAGHEQIAYATNIGADSGLDLDGGSVPDQCLVFLNPRLLAGDQATNYKLCAVLTHEFGHLDGQSHSEDPTSIMHSPPPASYMPCLLAVGYVTVPATTTSAPTASPAKPKKVCRQKNRKARRACQRKHS